MICRFFDLLLQNAAVVAVTNVYDNITEASIKRMVLPKVKSVFEKNLTDPKIVQNVLICVETLMDRMEKPEVKLIFICLFFKISLNVIILILVYKLWKNISL